jgi:K+-transporting ATPase ATPase C chain
MPGTAEGSLVRDTDGTVRGSRLVAQPFTEPRYFWPRPSAVGHAADAAGGSNLAPASPELRQRVQDTLALYGAAADLPLPADLVTASGSGLDPHISLAGALVQVRRVAGARELSRERVTALVESQAVRSAGPLGGAWIVNVLDLNRALDDLR